MPQTRSAAGSRATRRAGRSATATSGRWRRSAFPCAGCDRPGALRGFPAWLLRLVVHLAALTVFKHRPSVFFNWIVALFGGGRAERVITLQQVSAARHGSATAGYTTARNTRLKRADPFPTNRRWFHDHSPAARDYADPMFTHTLALVDSARPAACSFALSIVYLFVAWRYPLHHGLCSRT